MTRLLPVPTLFPYTTLFRSGRAGRSPQGCKARDDVRVRPFTQPRRGARSPCQLTLLVRRSEEHTSELQSRENLVCRLLLEKKNHIFSLIFYAYKYKIHFFAS